ncbi:oligopeptide/dipeptide ABC transporter ATP-binding protein [Prosthecodimorpha hirschii]|uniref:oligopeptide/dipeptide ABC transporter ATP-binding protein n=1 Tax=Prosthecodimorpha hirschii TaxID=665126 RepID=UPI001FEDD93C|nr:ABC transporter ATP-binding protein [Prosthecomicrobium hirschii]
MTDGPMTDGLTTDGPKTGGPILRFEDVIRDFTTPGGWFARRRVLRAVNAVTLDVPAGRVTGVVGESGCGKSTLARLALGLIKPTDGRVAFEGEDLATARRARLRQLRARMQMVFQDPYSSIDPRMTIGDAVLEPFVVQGIRLTGAARAAKAEALLGMVGLDPSLARNHPHHLSGGQKQRVGIARALALEPRLVVLDEPTASLDVSIQAQIVALLEALKARLDLTYLFISHDLALVRYFCDRIVVMYLGAVVEILPSPAAPIRHPYTRALLDSAFVPDPTRRQTLARATGEIPSAFDLPPGCVYAPRCPLADETCRRIRPQLDRSAHPVACHHPLDRAGAGS